MNINQTHLFQYFNVINCYNSSYSTPYSLKKIKVDVKYIWLLKDKIYYGTNNNLDYCWDTSELCVKFIRYFCGCVLYGI